MNRYLTSFTMTNFIINSDMIFIKHLENVDLSCFCKIHITFTSSKFFQLLPANVFVFETHFGHLGVRAIGQAQYHIVSYVSCYSREFIIITFIIINITWNEVGMHIMFKFSSLILWAVKKKVSINKIIVTTSNDYNNV